MLNEKKVTVRRKNVFLDVSPESVDAYLAKGYDVVDAFGNVITQHTPNDINTLKHAYDEHVAEIKKLNDRIKELESKLAEAKKTSAKSESKVESVAEEESKTKASGKKSKK